MTDATPNTPPGPFRNDDLLDQARRTAITSVLKEVHWEMQVRGDHKRKMKFGFLCHASFPDDVFFHLNAFDLPSGIDKAGAGQMFRVEVRPRFDDSKQRWGYAAARGTLISEPIPPAAPVNTEAPQTPSLARAQSAELQHCLKDIRFYASWGNGAGAGEVRSLSDRCLQLDPASQPRIEESIRLGQEDGSLLQPFYQLGTRLGSKFANHGAYQRALANLEQDRPDLSRRAKTQAKKGAQAKQRWVETKNLAKQGKPTSRVQVATSTAPALLSAPLPPPTRAELPGPGLPDGLHPCDLRALSPCPTWTLLIDETGTQFGPEANQLSAVSSKLGRFVGVLAPGTRRLAPLPVGWHAVDQSIEEIDRVIQAIIDVPAGVLGINVQQLPEAASERWAFGVIRLVELVLRLMPVQGQTHLDIQIEARGERFRRGAQWPAVTEQIRLRLADTYPERARLIDLQMRTVGKTDSTLIGYADAVAFINSGGSEHSHACLAASKLGGTCLLDSDTEALTRAVDWLDRGRTLDGRDWTTLLSHPDADQPAGLVSALLSRLGEAARADTTLWRRYLEQVTEHFDSRSLDLSMLGRQVEWLQQWLPAEETLPKPLRLLWLTAQLARLNHLGQTEQPWLEEMRQLADQLMDEDARLVCHAQLNLAVNATNRYDFAQAGQALQRWNPLETQPAGKLRGLLHKRTAAPPAEAVGVSAPKATAGLRYWGQVRSSLGQHAAFTGDPVTAVRFFDEALESFGQLSDPQQAQRESRQTQTYRAIALMDDPTQNPAEVRAAVETVIGPVPEALGKLAGTVASADRYAHHLALRWLVHRPDDALAAHYLARRDLWDQGEGHPWPLIQLYRGLLLQPQDPAAARELAMDGFVLATTADSGPVVRLIGACCRAIAAGWGETWETPESLLSDLTDKLPLAADRIARVGAYLGEDVRNPLSLLGQVLPFNFR